MTLVIHQDSQVPPSVLSHSGSWGSMHYSPHTDLTPHTGLTLSPDSCCLPLLLPWANYTRLAPRMGRASGKLRFCPALSQGLALESWLPSMSGVSPLPSGLSQLLETRTLGFLTGVQLRKETSNLPLLGSQGCPSGTGPISFRTLDWEAALLGCEQAGLSDLCLTGTRLQDGLQGLGLGAETGLRA